MKNLLKMLACLVFVFILAGVSFAKTERKSSVVKVKTYINCMQDSQCQQARKLAAGAAFQALSVCNDPEAFRDGRCTQANKDADKSKENAEYICGVFPDEPVQRIVPEGELVGNNLPGKKRISVRLKTST